MGIQETCNALVYYIEYIWRLYYNCVVQLVVDCHWDNKWNLIIMAQEANGVCAFVTGVLVLIPTPK